MPMSSLRPCPAVFCGTDLLFRLRKQEIARQTVVALAGRQEGPPSQPPPVAEAAEDPPRQQLSRESRSASPAAPLIGGRGGSGPSGGRTPPAAPQRQGGLLQSGARQAAAQQQQQRMAVKQQPRNPSAVQQPAGAAGQAGAVPRQPQRAPPAAMAVAAGQRSVAVLGPARRLPSQPPATMAAAQRVINQLPLSKAGAEERAAASRERKRGRQQELQAQQLLPLERLEYFFSKQEQQIQRRQLDASVRGKQQKQQPSWSMEAAEALCKLGMTAEQAMQALLAAHSHALRRAQRKQAEQLAGSSSSSGSGSDAKSGKGNAAAAATASAAMVEALPAVVPPVSPCQVEAACRELIATARVPVARLRQVLMDSPVLLTCSSEELQKAVSVGGRQQATPVGGWYCWYC